MSLSASVNDQRCRFNTKVAELRATQGKNVRMFTDDEYHEYLRKVKDKLGLSCAKISSAS